MTCRDYPYGVTDGTDTLYVDKLMAHLMVRQGEGVLALLPHPAHPDTEDCPTLRRALALINHERGNA